MKRVDKKGIEITHEDGIPCRTPQGFCYWDTAFANIVQQYLGRFCPDVSNFTIDTDGKLSPELSVLFTKSLDGKEVLAASVSLAEKKKLRVPESELEAFNKALVDFHRLAEQPGLPSANKAFIENFRIPDPRVMKEAWRVTKGSEPRLQVLWGYAKKNPTTDMILPQTAVSQNWKSSGGCERQDIARQLRETVQPVSTKRRSWWKWLTALFLASLVGVVLWWLLSSDLWCVRSATPESGGDDLLAYCDIHKITYTNECPKVCGVCKTHLGVEGVPEQCPNICRKCRKEHLENGKCPECDKVVVPPSPPKTCGIHECELVNDECPRICGVCKTHLGVEGSPEQCPNLCRKCRREHLENGKCPECDKVVVPPPPELVWIIEQHYDWNRSIVTNGKAIHVMEYHIVPPVQGIEWNKDAVQWNDLSETGSTVTTCGAVYKAKYIHEYIKGNKPKPLTKHWIQATNIVWTNKNEKIGGVGVSRMYSWPDAFSWTEPRKVGPEANGVTGDDRKSKPQEHSPDLPRPKNGAPIGVDCGYCGMRIPDNGQCPNLCKGCGAHLRKDESGGWTKCPNVCTRHRRHKIHGVCPDCSGDEIANVDCWIDVRSGNVSVPGRGKFDNMKFTLRSSTADLASAKVRWEDFIDGDVVFATNAVGSIEAADIMLQCVRSGIADNKMFGRHNLRASTVIAPDGKPVSYEANVSWKPNLTLEERKAIERHIRLCGEGKENGNEFFLFVLHSSPADPNVTVEQWEVVLDKGMDSAMPIRSCAEQRFANAIRLYKKDIPRDGCISISAKVNVGRIIRGSFAYVAGAIKIGGSISYKDYARAVSIYSDYISSIPQVITLSGWGTAFAVTDRDLITNYHVVRGHESKVELKVVDGSSLRKVPIKVASVDKKADLAWLRVVDGYRFDKPLRLAKSSGGIVGRSVLTLGYPGDADGKYEMKAGVVKEISGNPDRILHSAEVLPGNSGGPLVSIESGDVVGVTVSVKNREIGREAFYGNGCAIPVEQVPKSFPQLLAK